MDANGRKFATMARDKVSKNHSDGLNNVQSQEKARMFQTKDENDGYKALEL